MTIFTCEHEWEAMLTCIYEAYSSKKGHKNIKLLVEPIEQYTMFDEYVHVKSDPVKAMKLMDAINVKISAGFYSTLCYTSMAYEEDCLDIIYRMLLLGFHYGEKVLDMCQFKETMRFFDIRRRYSNEVNHFREFIRFHRINSDVYVAHIEPKSRIVLPLGSMFEDRMPSEHFMIVDDVHLEAAVHPKDEDYYIRKLTETELYRLKETELINDQYTDLWKIFFDSIAIAQRKNERCQQNLFPLWVRKHAVEFNDT